MLSMHAVNEYINTTLFENALYTHVLMLMSLLLIQISPSNFQEMSIKASSFLLFKYLNLYCYTLKVHFPALSSRKPMRVLQGKLH